MSYHPFELGEADHPIENPNPEIRAVRSKFSENAFFFTPSINAHISRQYVMPYLQISPSASFYREL